MLRYRGKYRVVCEMDLSTNKACEFTFIPCKVKKGSNIYRNSDTELFAYISSVIIGSRLLKEHPDLFRLFLQSDCEIILSFDESRMTEAIKVLKAWTFGKNIPPSSKKNRKFQNVERKSNQHR